MLADVTRSSGAANRKIEFKDLFERKRSFASLAKKRYYTIVEVYLDTCSRCRQLEAGLKPLMAKRKDAYLRRVHFPEGGMQFSFSGNSQQEVQAQVAQTNSLMQSYDVCGTPHVLVIGPDKNVLAADSCTSRHGTRFLQSWINAETGLLAKPIIAVTGI